MPNPLRKLTRAETAHLNECGWSARVGRGSGLWVRPDVQKLLVVRGQDVLRAYRCSTAKAGLCNIEGSHGTPTGWHVISEKIGHRLPRGAVLKGRRWTGEVWAGEQCDEDLILTRILRLRGMEDGINSGGRVDTWQRYIYIHGTNHTNTLGVASSHGCVRVICQDALELFRRVRPGWRVWIGPAQVDTTGKAR